MKTPMQLLKTMPVLLLACGFFCTMTKPEERASSGGTGSEIVGTATYDSSAMGKRYVAKASSASTVVPVINGNVFCYQRSASPDTNWAQSGALPRARTDSAGGFVIKDAPPGLVVVEANDGKGNGLVQTINVAQDSTPYSIGVLAVKKTGAITIQAQTQLPGRVRFYIGVMGTRLVVRGTQTNLDITLDNIPCGILHTISIRVYEPIYFALDLSNISISPGVTQALGSFQIK